MDWCADATVKEKPSQRSQCGGLAVSQNSNAQRSHAHPRCRFLLFILLTINDRCNARISAHVQWAEVMKPNVDVSSVQRDFSERVRRRQSKPQPWAPGNG